MGDVGWSGGSELRGDHAPCGARQAAEKMVGRGSEVEAGPGEALRKRPVWLKEGRC